jgi:hypothetical protein
METSIDRGDMDVYERYDVLLAPVSQVPPFPAD